MQACLAFGLYFMRKFIKITIFILLFLLVLTSCSNQNDYNSNIDTSQEEKVAILFGITSPDPDKHILEYNGEPINISFNAENKGISGEWGLRLYVNGFLQDFKAENNALNDMYIFKLEKEQECNFDFSFSPIIGKKGDELTVHFILYYNPNYVLNDNKYFGYDNNHDISQLLPWKLIMNADSEGNIVECFDSDLASYSSISDNIEKEYVDQYDENMKPINLLEETTFIEHFQTENDYDTLVYDYNNKSISTTIRGFGLPEKYKVSFYINHQLVNAFDGSPYCIINVKKDLISEIKVSFSYDFNTENNFAYIIAVPIYDSYNFDSSDVLKTNSMKILME